MEERRRLSARPGIVLPMTAPHPALSKIRKLLAKAEDPAATPEEAETYTARAAQLMAAHGIDQALLAADDPTRDVVGDRVVEVPAPFARDKAQLLSEIALRLRCRAVLRVHRRRHHPTAHSVHLFGHRSDLDRTDLLFTSLLLQCTTQLGRTEVPPWEHKAAFRRSWLAGFTMSVSQRLAVTEAGAETAAADRTSRSGRSTSLVLADRGARVERALQDAYPAARTARRRELSGAGLEDGYLAGELADLGDQRLPGGRRALPGAGRARPR